MKRFIVLFAFLSSVIHADTITVGVHAFPPCVMTDNNITGFDVELLDRVAKITGVTVNYKVYDSFTTLLNDVKDKKIDLAASGITITSEREQLMDFTHPYLNSGLVILTKKDKQINPLRVIGAYLNNMKFSLILLLCFLFICSLLIWFIERGKASFSKNFFKGIADGIYWVNTTISTVGYGDKTPSTWVGKFFTVIVMWIGIGVIFPFVVASMNNAFSSEVKMYEINSVDDLKNKTVGTENGTTTETYLAKVGAQVRTEDHIETCYEKLAKGQVDAVVFDMPSIKYYLKNGGRKQCVEVGEMFDKQTYGFALQQGSKWREPFNEALLDFMKTDEFQSLQTKWFSE